MTEVINITQTSPSMENKVQFKYGVEAEVSDSFTVFWAVQLHDVSGENSEKSILRIYILFPLQLH